ncbi:MAG: 3-hydroxyacyl-CoA dehydrogenase NAD-binding domain-containing protein [Spirochaetota bacterium]
MSDTSSRDQSDGRRAGDTTAAQGTAPVTFSRRDSVGAITFDAPGEKLNVLRSGVVEALGRALDEAEAASDLDVLLVKSAKPDCFIAGADLREIVGITNEDEAREKARTGQEMIARLARLRVPTVALVNGTCLGGGLELALACDYRVTTDNEKTSLGLPETSLGIVPGFGGTYRLPKVAGMAQAVRMILSGKPVDGKTAFKRGLADAFYPQAFAEEWTLTKFVPSVQKAGGRRAVRKRRRRKPLGVKLSENNPLGRFVLYRGARKQTFAKTNGNYPAPLRALRLLRAVPGSSERKALARERSVIGELVPTPIAKNLIGLFLAREAAKRQEAISGDARQIDRAAVLGAGVMGGRISWLFSHVGVPVVMKDIYEEALRSGYESAYEVYRFLAGRGKYSEREVLLGMHKLHGTTRYDDLGNPDVLIEAVVENLDVKTGVLKDAEEHSDEEAVIATNTSSLTVNELAKALRRPERFGGMHFFNPANKMPLVEVVAGEKTSARTVRTLGRLAVRLGKVPVVVNDCPGFLVNRMLMPYLNEALVMAEEGEEFTRIDRVIKQFGMPMGPFRLLDEVGLDIARDVAESLIRGYGERMKAGSFLETIGDEEELLGKKGGEGFYRYGSNGGDDEKPNPRMRELLRSARRDARSGRLSEDEIVNRPMLAMLNEAARALDEGIVDSAEHLDLALVLGIGFAPFRGGICRYADDMGLPEVCDRLRSYAERYGERFTPAPLLERLAEEGGALRSEAVARG